MKKIIAFAGSNSNTSINKELVTFAGSLLVNTKVEVLDLNDFEVPTYSVNIEQVSGIDENAKKFYNKLEEADGLIISLAEHNGFYTAAFKSLFDWLSRINMKMFQNKPVLLMSTSPGGRGGQSVFDFASTSLPRHDANIVSTFLLPSFGDNFNDGTLVNPELLKELTKSVKDLEASVLK
ncbi:NADPH-dependent FMN reductase [Aurantibacter sp.]|uniref:NADPH-dependent FMN reductase n=1 Tax=Aurantibacter sp. TaxID=2807103 RepID=UPI0035C79C4D